MNTFFLDRLNSEPHALAFAGQSTPWPVALADQSANPALDEALHTHAAAAQALLYPVSAELLATTGRPVDLFGFEPNPARLGAAAAASASVPGIALTQLGALLDAAALGYNPAQAKPVAVLGHSQGVLAVHMVQAICEAGSIDAAAAKIDEILAIATLIGVAGTRQARQLGLAARHGEATPMLSVKDITRAQVDALIERVDVARGPIAVAVTNSATHYVLSGYPEDLAAFGVEVAKEHKRQAKLREEKVRGGRVFDPTLEYLDVTLPFHSPLMADAVSQAVAWAEACGINADHARELAAEVLLNHVDWAARVRALMKSTDPSALWVLDFGPGNTVGKLFSTVAQGTGVGVVEASTVADRGSLSTLDTLPERTQNWTRFAPSIIHTSAGDKVRTAFTELTGKAPVLLAGMTPTTVEPEIVAGRARRRRPGHRQRVRPSRGQARGGTRGRPHRRIQRHVHGPLPVEPAVRLPAHRAEEARQRHADRRRRRLRRHSGIRRGRGTHPQPQRRRLPVRELQAGHRRPDPPGGAHRQGRRANQGAHRGRRRLRRRPPLLGIA